MSYLFFDTETTGFEDAHIVQLAAVLTDNCNMPRAELNVLIKPDGWIIPAEATAVHGILTETCEQFGIPIRDALTFFDSLAQRAQIIVAHNYDFDAKMIGLERRRLVAADAEVFCTMKASTDIVRLPGRYGYKWPKLSEAYSVLFNEEMVNAHDAMTDVRACRRIFFELRKREGVAAGA